MNVALLMIFHFIFVTSVHSDAIISDDDYQLLPPIFYIEPFEQCIQKKDLFCRISIKLISSNIHYPSKTWKLIEESKKSKHFYHHDELFHAICIEKQFKIGRLLEKHVSDLYTNKYEIRGLKATVEDINCDHFEYHLRTFDIILLCFIILYLLLIIGATFYDFRICRNVSFNRIILFSLRHNLKKLKVMYHRTPFEELKCIQAIRFYTTVLIIFCHTFCSFAAGYVADTKYFENIHTSIFRRSIQIVFVFLVQTFFLVSGWLLSYHTFIVFKENREINLYKYALLTFCNRYLRIIPPVLFMVCLARSIWIYGFFHGPVRYVYSDKEYQRCQSNWWINFLFLNNHYQRDDMCYVTTWYLAADMQLYGLSLICLMTIFKCKQMKTFIMLMCLVIGIIIPCVVSYIYDFEVIYNLTPRNLKNNMFLTFEFSATYTSTYVNMATYMLGLIFGYFYFYLRSKTLFTTKFSIFVWWLLVLGLLSIVIIIPFFEYSRITSAILAGVVKPLFGLGIGMAILGISQKCGGVLATVCEWKPAIFLGTFTYSTYVVHFGIVFYRTASSLEPLRVSDYILATAFLQDFVISFICGFLVYIMFEMPLSQLQQIFVPKYSAKRITSGDLRQMKSL